MGKKVKPAIRIFNLHVMCVVIELWLIFTEMNIIQKGIDTQLFV